MVDMSSEDLGPRREYPHPGGSGPKPGPRPINDGGCPDGHSWEIVWEEVFGRVSVCRLCGREWIQRF